MSPKKLLGAAGALLMVLTPASLWAQGRPPDGAIAPQSPAHDREHGGQPGRQDHRPGGNQPGARPPGSNGGPGMDNGFGRWDNRWGARPSGPPSHWNKRGDWYRHVRACQQRYRSYNSRTDSFYMRRGQQRRCTL